VKSKRFKFLIRFYEDLRAVTSIEDVTGTVIVIFNLYALCTLYLFLRMGLQACFGLRPSFPWSFNISSSSWVVVY
jgi:hypothetical protein